jgi:hypothetical protein
VTKNVSAQLKPNIAQLQRSPLHLQHDVNPQTPPGQKQTRRLNKKSPRPASAASASTVNDKLEAAKNSIDKQKTWITPLATAELAQES